jgi:hypothetical protein
MEKSRKCDDREMLYRGTGASNETELNPANKPGWLGVEMVLYTKLSVAIHKCRMRRR